MTKLVREEGGRKWENDYIKNPRLCTPYLYCVFHNEKCYCQPNEYV